MLRQISNSTSPEEIIDDLNLPQIIESPYSIRTGSNEKIDALAKSFQQNGPLNAILVRIKNERMYGIVAGNWKYNACKSMGLRTIPCQIVELDDKDALEFSLIENIKRKNLCPIEEAQAFKKYVSDLGWGGASGLGEKLGKSLSYIIRCINLLDLASDVVNYIMNSSIYASSVEDLFSINDKKIQSGLAKFISSRKVTLKEDRELLYNPDLGRAESIAGDWPSSPKDLGERKLMKSFDKSISTLRIAIARVRDIINNVDNDDYDWMTRQICMYYKNVLYQQIDLLLEEKRKRDNLNPPYSSDKNASKKYLSEFLRRGKSSIKSSLSISKTSSGLTKLIVNPKCYLRLKISPCKCVIKRSDS